MTITADPEGRKGNAFDYGSGFVNPKRVLDPGLIYDAEPVDYKAFLCSIGYSEKLLRLITRDNSSTCDQTFATATALNYPSITVPNLKDDNYTSVVTRTLTNVGKPRSIYKAIVSSPTGINLTVVPYRLAFSHYGQKLNFSVHLKVAAAPQSHSGYVFGSLSWRNRYARVTSPLVVRVAPPTSFGLMR